MEMRSNFGSFSALLLLMVVARFETSIAQGEAGMTVCPVNVQQFILRDASLLPRANVIATSEDATNNPGTNFIETTSPPWCTAEGEGVDGRRNYVELTFTEQIVVEFFESSGLLESWVSNFSIEYSQTVSGEDFVAYGVLETPQSFIVADILTSPGYFALERPIVARRLRMVINSGTADTFGRFCWEVEMFGCTLSRARQVQDVCQGTLPPQIIPTTDPVGPDTPSQSMPPNSPAPNCPDTSDATISQSQKQQEILIIVLPIALATIVIILIIAILSILICVCVTRRSSKGKPAEDPNATNACFLYDSPRPSAYDVPRASIRSRGGSFQSSNDTLHTAISNEVKNPIYITKQGSNPGPVAPHPFSSLSNNQVESSATNDYEMISENVTTMDNRLYEMQRSISQMSASSRPELPAARTSSHYATIPGGGILTTPSPVMDTNQPPEQTDVTRETNVNVAPSVKSHGYAKVHKPSNGQPKAGPDVVPAVNDNSCNQTTL